MHKYHKKFLDQTLALGLPVNAAGYAEDELLFIEQFVVEYAAHGLDIAKEMNSGRLPVLIRGHTILIARSDAENWYDKYFDLLMSRLLRDDTTCKAFPATSTSAR
jgi:hypothetical protein